MQNFVFYENYARARLVNTASITESGVLDFFGRCPVNLRPTMNELETAAKAARVKKFRETGPTARFTEEQLDRESVIRIAVELDRQVQKTMNAAVNDANQRRKQEIANEDLRHDRVTRILQANDSRVSVLDDIVDEHLRAR